MMRFAVAVVLLTGHLGSALKSRGYENSGLENVLNMLKGMLQAAINDARAHATQCAVEITELRTTRDHLREDLSRYIGANNMATKSGATRVCTGCGGEWLAEEDKRVVCQNDKIKYQGQAATALAEYNTIKYDETDPSPVQCKNYSTTPPADDDLSECATTFRIEFKESQKVSVAQQCKKTNEIMEIAISIYKSKGLGASFVQLAQQIDVRPQAVAFLQAHSETERNAELLKMLHDFHAQVKRDCHQDLSDLSSDIHSLKMHLTSQQNSAKMENEAHKKAVQRAHEAQKCETAAENERNRIHEAAFLAGNSFFEICATVGDNTCSNSYGAQQMDFTCEWLSEADRSSAGCEGTYMFVQADCKKIADQFDTYEATMEEGMKVMQQVINQQAGPAFIQLSGDKNTHEESLVQTGKFDDLRTAIKTAMENIIHAQQADTSDVNQFAQQCEEMLTPLDLPEGEEVGGCTVKSGQLCQDQSPLPDTCAVCIQESQCDFNQEQKNMFANLKDKAQHEEDLAHDLYTDAQTAFAAATARRTQEATAYAQYKAQHETNEAGFSQAQAVFVNFMNSAAAGAMGTETMQKLNTLMAEMKTKADTTFASKTAAETALATAWASGDSSNPLSKAYWEYQVDTQCNLTLNLNAGVSHYCTMESWIKKKIEYAAQEAKFDALLFNDCTRTASTLNKMKAALAARKLQCKVGIVKDLKEELSKMTEALQILSMASAKIKGTS